MRSEKESGTFAVVIFRKRKKKTKTCFSLNYKQTGALRRERRHCFPNAFSLGTCTLIRAPFATFGAAPQRRTERPDTPLLPLPSREVPFALGSSTGTAGSAARRPPLAGHSEGTPRPPAATPAPPALPRYLPRSDRASTRRSPTPPPLQAGPVTRWRDGADRREM